MDTPVEDESAKIATSVDALETLWAQSLFVVLDERSARNYSCLVCEVIEIDGDDPRYFPDGYSSGDETECGHKEGDLVLETARMSFRQCGGALYNLDIHNMDIDEFKSRQDTRKMEFVLWKGRRRGKRILSSLKLGGR